MSKDKNLKENGPATVKSGPDILLLLLQAIFSVILFTTVRGQQAYQAGPAPFQIFAYLLIFNLTGLVFQHLSRPFLSKKALTVLGASLGLSLLYVYIISFYPVLDLNGDNANFLSRTQSLIMGKGFRDMRLPLEPYAAHLPNFGFSVLNIPFVLLFGLDNPVGLKLLEFCASFLGLFIFFRYFEDKLPRNPRKSILSRFRPCRLRQGL